MVLEETHCLLLPPLQSQGAGVQGGEGPLADEQGGQEGPLAVQVMAEPLLPH